MIKLTLSADPATIELAKSLAAEQGTSVSAMFERFVALAAAKRRIPAVVAPLTRSVSGLVRLPKGRGARALLEDALIDRHGL
ncbi:MAG: hypothetical protein H0X38_05835 [Planctomycetes bacterium]|nr:hypothetical protein [Planctomycetota bacterium]